MSLSTTVYVSRIGRWRWRILASTVPAGGTRVDEYVIWGRKRAERRAARVHAERNAAPRYAEDSYALHPHQTPAGGHAPDVVLRSDVMREVAPVPPAGRMTRTHATTALLALIVAALVLAGPVAVVWTGASR